MRRFVAFAALSSLLFISSSVAADLTGLSLGQFVFDETDGAKAPVVKTESIKGSISAEIKIDGVSANADGEKTEATATFAGQFLANQPKRADLSSFKATVSGLVVKTAGSTARIDLAFGDVKKTVSWAEADVKSERYSTDIIASFPGGRIPTPFPVSALLFAKKPSGDGTVLITVDTIKIDMGPALVGDSNEGPQNTNPTLPKAAPDIIASRSSYFRL